jgi:membrane-bound serine protease (ClpP class)
MKLVYSIILSLLIFTSQTFALQKINYIEVKAGIGPGISDYISHAIERSQNERAVALIIELNTPGGLLETTRDIVSDIIDARVPVIVYVHPPGARAGSAGTFITLAGNIAAMTPGTNIGAAHPVGIGGESDSGAMFDKVTNDAAAFIRSIAQKRGKNIEWAESAVRESKSITENEALKLGVIDIVAKDIWSLIYQLDGKIVETAAGQVTLRTKHIKLEKIDKSWKQEMLIFLSDPNIAYIFIMLAIYGIMFELYNPGSVLPGVVGGISAILAGYSLQMLPVNYAGLALIILAIILFIVEIKVVSYGMLSVGGIISFVIGSIMLIDSPYEFMEISLSIIITSAVLTALFFLVVIGLGLKAQKKAVSSGTEPLLHQTAVALNDFINGKGKVKVSGETWNAVSEDSISKGDEVEVLDIQKLVLKVRKVG